MTEYFRFNSLVPRDDPRPGQVRQPDPELRLRARLRPPRLHRPRLQEEEEGVRRHRLPLQTVISF